MTWNVVRILGTIALLPKKAYEHPIYSFLVKTKIASK